MKRIAIITLLSIAIIPLVSYAQAVPYDYAWGWNHTEGYFKIYIVTTDDLSKYDRCLEYWQGCALTTVFSDRTERAVILLEGTEWDYSDFGCNIYTHEMLHHWGYSEQMIWDFFKCDGVEKYDSLPHTGFWK